MMRTPPSTTSSSSTRSSNEQFRVVRKRNRIPLSCAPCRQRKLKCNRSHPCENCVKRGDTLSCTYVQPDVKRRSTTSQNPSTPDEMQNRIGRLENLVLSLMTNGAQAPGPAAAMAAISGSSSVGSRQDSQEADADEDGDAQEESETEAVTRSLGVMKVDNNKCSFYVSDAHWVSVLNDIAEVRQYLTSTKKQFEEQEKKLKAAQHEAETSTLLFGTAKPVSRSEIMANFPSKYITDIIIARYFEAVSPCAAILHVEQFQREYEEHWKDSSKTSIAWIAMLFSMMRTAMLSYSQGDEPPEFRGKSLDMAWNFRKLTAECLVLADYMKPQPYILETLLFHLTADYTSALDNNTSNWIMTGIIVRLAMRQGYHRDSKMFPNITPFQGEMRRRVWAVVRQADIFYSFQAGMPTMLRSVDTDTDLPRNLNDEDFGPDSKEIPPSRPSNEVTPVSCLIAMGRVAFAFGRIIEDAMKVVKNSSYDFVMELDAELRRAYDQVPDHLKMQPLEECKADSPELILSRLQIHGVYLKGQCVLHRRYLARARHNPRFTHSRRVCIDASLELLRYQEMLHRESTIASRLAPSMSLRKCFLSTTDFVLAASIICLDLYYGLQLRAAGRPSGDVYIWGRERWDEMLAAIRRSHGILAEQRETSLYAFKAYGLLELMLAKLTFNPQTSNPSTYGVPDEKQNAAMTLGMLSSGISPLNSDSTPYSDSSNSIDQRIPQGAHASSNEYGFSTPFGMLGNQMSDLPPLNLDWDAWDSYIQNPTVESQSGLWPALDPSLQMPQMSSESQTSSDRDLNLNFMQQEREVASDLYRQ
ncbi:hypothetical protein VTN31DRAFT_2785 [Thermomyces dupontii]|uniref:uncharacterized protein n=1 Tax=Talaromyces thermophilus TaxID=28565 RepID=UPI003742CB53